MSQQQPPGGPGNAEHLEGPAGWDRPEPSPSEPRRGPRRGLLVGGGVLAAALVGGGVWAWSAYFEQGAQPAEALPGDTLAYAAVDLDPTGQQKLEAIRMLKKFPAIEEELDLELDDDLRRTLFEAIQADGTCTELDYAADVEPWLGDRAAIAAVPGDDRPDPVGVLQVTDQDAAEAGLEALAACAGDGAATAYAFTGEWVVLAETEEVATGVAQDSQESTLADDEDFRARTDAVGDPGVVTLYAAPEAGDVMYELMAAEGMDAELGDDEQVRAAFEDFPGAAGTVRFRDGAVELEVATGELTDDQGVLAGAEGGADAVRTLPGSTAMAIGFGLQEGWGEAFLEQLRPVIEADTGLALEEAVAEFEQETGLSVPDDLETLFGDSVAVAFGGDFEPEAIFSGQLDTLPVGMKIEGDADAIEGVLDKLRAQLGPEAAMLRSRQEGDHVVLGVSEAYLEQLAADGGLGDEAAFEKVVPEADRAAGVFYVNFDAGDWLTRLAAFDTSGEAERNLAPLEAFGASSWVEDGGAHALVKLTTED